jgi:hypothetical protein
MRKQVISLRVGDVAYSKTNKRKVVIAKVGVNVVKAVWFDARHKYHREFIPKSDLTFIRH